MELKTQTDQQLKCPSEDASVPLVREKKVITGGEGGTWERKWMGRRNLIWYWVREKD